MRGVKWAAALVLLIVSSDSAWAGWEIEQTNYNLRSSGKEIGRSSATMRVSKDRIRVTNEMTVTVFDYDKDAVALLLPTRKMYWAGTVDEYLVAAQRANPKRRTRPGEVMKRPKPEIVVQETPITAEIAGKQAKKYAIVVDGRAFQEIWVSEPFLGDDLNLTRYQSVQRRLSENMRSSYGSNLVALSENPLYKKFSTEGYPVRTHTYLGEAIMGTEIVQIKQMDIPDSDFAVPEGFERVPLMTLLDAQQVLYDEKAAELRKRTEHELPRVTKTPVAPKKSDAKKGEEAPDFNGTLADGRQLRLRDYRGRRHVVLYFYPKDFTPGCTKEACTFRDRRAELARLDAEIVGVSLDTPEKHGKFADKYSLPYPLVSDGDGRISSAFGVQRLGGWLPSKRVTFVIGKDGLVHEVIHSELNIDKHIDEAIAALAKLQKKATAG